MSWQSLRVLLAKDFLVALVFIWEAFLLFVFFVNYLWGNDCPADVVSVLVGLPGCVSGSRYEDGFFESGA